MRLSEAQRTIISEEVRRHFGTSTSVPLFGSRARDDLRGSDIDLYIDARGNVEQMLERELALYAALRRRLGEQRIDIVVHCRHTALHDIDLEARKSGVPL